MGPENANPEGSLFGQSEMVPKTHSWKVPENLISERSSFINPRGFIFANPKGSSICQPSKNLNFANPEEFQSQRVSIRNCLNQEDSIYSQKVRVFILAIRNGLLSVNLEWFQLTQSGRNSISKRTISK